MSANKKLTVLAVAAILVPLLIALFPVRRPGNIDLGDPMFEAGIFCICMLLWLMARVGRSGGDTYFVFRSNVWDVDQRMCRRNIVASVIEFLLLAGILQFLKILIPDRQPSIEKFLFDAALIILLGLIFYLGLILMTKIKLGRRSITKKIKLGRRSITKKN